MPIVSTVCSLFRSVVSECRDTMVRLGKALSRMSNWSAGRFMESMCRFAVRVGIFVSVVFLVVRGMKK